jgi:hypothetical protein
MVELPLRVEGRGIELLGCCLPFARLGSGLLHPDVTRPSKKCRKCRRDLSRSISTRPVLSLFLAFLTPSGSDFTLSAIVSEGFLRHQNPTFGAMGAYRSSP